MINFVILKAIFVINLNNSNHDKPHMHAYHWYNNQFWNIYTERFSEITQYNVNASRCTTLIWCLQAIADKRSNNVLYWVIYSTSYIFLDLKLRIKKLLNYKCFHVVDHSSSIYARTVFSPIDSTVYSVTDVSRVRVSRPRQYGAGIGGLPVSGYTPLL